MGLFTKYQLVCEDCGKMFQSMNSQETLCDGCRAKNKDLKKSLDGYEKIRMSVLKNTKTYDMQDLKRIDAHRRDILNRHPSEARISAKEMHEAAESYRSLTQNQALSIIDRALSTEVDVMLDTYYVNHMYFPLGYEGTVVDSNDVFAISVQIDEIEVDKEFGAGDILMAGMRSMISTAMGSLTLFIPGAHSVKMDVAKCVAYTCDPYMPMFLFRIPLPGESRILSKKKQQQAVEDLKESLHLLFPNLTYEVQLYDNFKKQIQKEKAFRAPVPIDHKTTKSMVSFGYIISSGIEDELPQSMNEFLASYGYYTTAGIMNLLQADAKSDKDPRRKFWGDILEKVRTERMNGTEIPDAELPEMEMSAASPTSATTCRERSSMGSEVDFAQKSKADTPESDTSKPNEPPLMQYTRKKEWFCPMCGKKNNGNFCGACGQKRP